MQYTVLGPLAVRDGDDAVAVRGPTQRLILAALLLEPGRPVSADRLTYVVWGDAPPASSSGSLHAHISRLRKALGEGSIATSEAGYSLQVGEGALDAAEFERLLSSAYEQAGDLRLGALGTALRLWDGAAFEEHRDHDHFRLEAQRLEERRLAARELLAETLIDLGRLEEAVAELRPLCGDHSLRESAVLLLMRALYQLGRHPESLREYQRLSEQLADLGLEPGPDIKDLELRILTHAEERVSRSGVDRRSNLPHRVSTFLGRDDEIAELSGLLGANRLVTIVGPGGIGKTSLAVELAHVVGADYSGGTWLCELAPVRDPEDLGHAVAHSLGLGTIAESPAEALIEFLHSRKALLVFDNCEHIGPGVAQLTSQLLRGCPDVVVVATSRERVGVRGEQIYALRPLGTDDDAAAQLFIDRARTVRPDYDPTPEIEAVRSICERLDGLPLAIEMAAARLRTLSATEIAARLDGRLALLRSADRTADVRHQSLRHMIDWSYELLTDPERDVFAQLSVCAGGFDLAAAEGILQGIDRVEILDQLEGLVDRSLLYVQHSPEGTRYRMLETLREYAAEVLERSGECDAAAGRHASWYVDLAERAASLMRGEDERLWSEVVDREIDNLRTAYAWAVSADASDLALRLANAVFSLGYNRAASEFLEWAAGLVALPSGVPDGEPVVDAAAAALAVSGGEIDEAERLVRQAIATAADPGSLQLAYAHEVLSDVLLMAGDLAAARTEAEKSQAIFAAAGDRFGECQALVNVAVGYSYGGDVAKGLESAAQLAAISEALANPTQLAWAAFTEAEVVLDTDPPRAIAAARRAIQLAREAGAGFTEAVAGLSLASLEARHGDPAVALEECRRNLLKWRSLGDRAHQMVLIRNMVVLLTRLGAHEQSAVLFGGVVSAQGAPPHGDELTRWEAARAQISDALGEDGAVAAIARGSVARPMETADYALATVAELIDPSSA